jgi:hypothetical protein
MERFEKRHQWLATYLDEGNALGELYLPAGIMPQ